MSITTTTIKYRFASVENSAYIGSQYDNDTNSYITVQGPRKPNPYDIGDCTKLADNDTHLYTVTETKHIGCVVSKHTESVRVMSDVWEMQSFATVWDAEHFTFRDVFISGSEFRRDYSNEVTIDATPEVLEYYKVWQQGRQFRISESAYDNRQYEAYQDRITPNKGKFVEVVKGRKVPRGTKGLVFWTGHDNWGNVKVGIATSPNKNSRGHWVDVVWTASSNCKVLQQPLF